MTNRHEHFKALIVDDSFLMRSRLSRVLADEPRISRVDLAEDGLVALNMVKEDDYDIILLDIEMPNMDGMEFLKRSKFHTEAKIIVLSSTCVEGSERSIKAQYFGAFDVASKPQGIFSHEEILHRVYSAIKAIEDADDIQSKTHCA